MISNPYVKAMLSVLLEVVAIFLVLYFIFLNLFFFITKDEWVENKNIAAECEAQLPRHQNCKLIAVVEEE